MNSEARRRSAWEPFRVICYAKEGKCPSAVECAKDMSPEFNLYSDPNKPAESGIKQFGKEQ